MRTRVIHVHQALVQIFSCSPREAVIAAYAKSLGDYNTWDYARKYAALVTEGDVTVKCGNFISVKDPAANWHQL